ncbi:DUF2911 domain-containing protein [Reichenbachiella agarivorans]|uniref:DUF2911 domain-containing protein n=1 Tax=Reichenbachiella agarivorans TaxID=2979464 RepID=A0ABY6CM99_9BACT|nr:DUF2911 domain-containing protein [Reichenbachiella agarivorans]UXP31626.1 DUF2911 domain-containing protein [Reichenbachiella agarivorans]
MMNKERFGGWVLISVLVFGMGCHRPEYSHNYVSEDSSDFEEYRENASNRPSPPARTSQVINSAKVYITYSQPGVKDREIWGDLVKYDKIWRTGANEATVFSTDQIITIEGQTINPGNYALYTIPSENEWEVILNKKYDVWGAYDYDESLDVLRFKVYPTKREELQERMNFNIAPNGLVTFSWEYLQFQFQLTAQ